MLPAKHRELRFCDWMKKINGSSYSIYRLGKGGRWPAIATFEMRTKKYERTCLYLLTFKLNCSYIDLLLRCVFTLRLRYLLT